MKYLIVEDEFLIQRSLKKLLEKKGVEVTCCSRGLEAINEISKDNFDRIICDLMLQDITGFDVIEEAKRFINANDIGKKFVIITAYSSTQVLKKASQYNCIVISKPFENIEKTIDSLLDLAEK